jgi:uncharacterized protein YuzE
MKLNYYPQTDSLYIDLIDAPSTESEEVRPGIVLDFNAQGQLVGIDVQNASKHTDLTQLDIDNLPARISARSTEAA